MRPMDYATYDALTRLHFTVFLRRVLAEIDPAADYRDNFHIHVIAEALEDLRAGRGKRLAIAVPPRSLKSIMVSVAYVAWVLGHDPAARVMCASYGQELADKMASDCRQVMLSGWYKRLFPRTRLAAGRQALSNFQTTQNGGRFSTSVGGTVTGMGADYIILDDPMKPEEALSEVERRNANDWVQHTLLTRANDKRTARFLVVMQRLHQDDVIGALKDKQGDALRLLAFPAIMQRDETYRFQGPFGPRTIVKREGEALHPDRESLADLEEQRTLMGTSFFASQYLQSPVPLEGNLVKRAWLRYFVPGEEADPDLVVQSWDTASKPGELNDFSVGTTWAIKGDSVYLLDVQRERLDLPALRHRVVQAADRFKADFVLVEDKGSGIGLVQDLSPMGYPNIKPILPKGDKIMRLGNVAPMFEQGRVFLPPSAPWLDIYRDEITGFPSTRYDDQVDSTSQALAWIREQGDPGGIFHYYRAQAAKRLAFSQNRNVLMRAPPDVTHHYGIDGTSHLVAIDQTVWLSERDAGPARNAGFVDLN